MKSSKKNYKSELSLKQLFCLTICLSISTLFLNCSQPTEVQTLYLSNSSPENVILNLVMAYREKNLTEYLNCLSDSFLFSSFWVGSWGKQEEQLIHQALFSQELVLEVNLTSLRKVDGADHLMEAYSAYYFYDLNLRTPESFLEHAKGHITFRFVQEDNKGWFIENWQESDLIGLRKSFNKDSIDYFPLQVGNYWIYEEQNLKRNPDIKASVLDSIIVQGMPYYEVESFTFVDEYGYNFIRSDSAGKLIGLYKADSSEVMLYDFTASVGDTWSFPMQNYNARVIVLLEGRNGSFHTPAGNFDQGVGFSSHVENTGTIIIEEFALNVGMISTAVENESWVLKEARINGKTIPDTTVVGIKEKTWGEIKSHYLKRNLKGGESQ